MTNIRFKLVLIPILVIVNDITICTICSFDINEKEIFGENGKPDRYHFH